MNILVTGAAGQLGTDVTAEALRRGHQVAATDADSMDITDPKAVKNTLNNIKPDCVIHCAAYTQVDAAQEQAALCRKINADGTQNIADACRAADCKLIYPSTDYVFDGSGTEPWRPHSRRCPLNVYGQTKYEGELAVQQVKKHYIVRIAWVFGKNGKNFVNTMLKLAQNHCAISVVNDQIGTPTYTADLARLLCDMAQREQYGVYHVTNSGGYISWYDFARAIFEQSGKAIDVIPVTSAQFAAKAPRPLNSRLDQSDLEKNGFEPLPHWQDALKRYLTEIGAI